MSLAEAHTLLGWLVVAVNGAAGLWATAAQWADRLRVAALWRALAVAHVLVGVQLVVGVIDMQRRTVEVSGLHMFYGFIALVSIAIIYSYRQQLDRYRFVLFGIGTLFLMGLALRAMFIPALGTSGLG